VRQRKRETRLVSRNLGRSETHWGKVNADAKATPRTMALLVSTTTQLCSARQKQKAEIQRFVFPSFASAGALFKLGGLSPGAA
jgi:hypothetical protein